MVCKERGKEREGEGRRGGRGRVGGGEREKVETGGREGGRKQHYSSSIPGSQGQIMATQQFDVS